jgi:hypothetical protein
MEVRDSKVYQSSRNNLHNQTTYLGKHSRNTTQGEQEGSLDFPASRAHYPAPKHGTFSADARRKTQMFKRSIEHKSTSGVQNAKEHDLAAISEAKRDLNHQSGLNIHTTQDSKNL